MPFTVSHVAAVVPIARRPLSVPALVCGAMAPDLPYYLALPVSAAITHSLLGILVADVPLTLVMLAVYYGLLARAVPVARNRDRQHAHDCAQGRVPAFAVGDVHLLGQRHRPTLPCLSGCRAAVW
jgi:Domain of unknown function (DUF4184)